MYKENLATRRTAGRQRLADEIFRRHFWEGRQAALSAKIENVHAEPRATLLQLAILFLNLRKLPRERMTASRRKKVIVSEINSNEPNPRRTHVYRQAQRRIWRIARVRQQIGVGEIGAGASSQVQPHLMWMGDAQIELTEHHPCA